MKYWLSHKDGKIIEQVLCEDGEDPLWSDDSEGATLVEVERHGDALAEVLDTKTKTWSKSVPHAIKLLKEERNRKLLECDFPPLFERPENEQAAWKKYRQDLRDLPDNTPDPLSPVWPKPPKKK